jgi:hypothetical protein
MINLRVILRSANCKIHKSYLKANMDVKLVLLVLTGVFTVACLFFGTRNGFYDSDNYHGNGSAH